MKHKELRSHKGRIRITADMLTELIKSNFNVSPEFEIRSIYNEEYFDLITCLAVDSQFEVIPEGQYIPVYELQPK